jgi:DNA polymerase I
MEKRQKFILIDCSGLAYAAFYTYGHLSYNGDKTGVAYGFLEKVLGLAQIFKTKNFIFCWDSIFTHRKELFWDYKKKRAESREKLTEEEILELVSFSDQKMLIEGEILPSMGFRNSFKRMGFEADDLLAVWTNNLHHHNQRIVMVTTDKDMYQCLDKCNIIFNPMTKKIFTAWDLEKTYGVTPAQWAMAKAIGGCSGDGVPGIVGAADPKSPTSKALKYVRGELKAGKIYDRVVAPAGQEIIKRNLKLVKLPFRGKLIKRMTLKENKFSSKKFISTFEKYGFASFLKKNRLEKWKENFL